ncbi:MAG: tetratricopeptide repeat protein [Planctomycetota bacterium]
MMKRVDQEAGGNRIWEIITATLLALCTTAVYFSATGHEFVSFDDREVVYENPYVLGGLSLQNLKWAFTTSHFSNWMPLTWVSLQIDSTVWGTDAFGYHISNVLIHAINVVLVFLIFRRLGCHQAAATIGALFFAIHPLNVQPVCWIAERKGVLSSAFWLASVLCYVRYLRSEKKAAYLATGCFLVCSLLCKQAAIVFPVQALILSFLHDGTLCNPQRKLVLRRIYSAIPWAIICVCFAIVAFQAQASGGSIGTGDAYPLIQRITRVFTNSFEYILRFLFPVKLQFHYHNYGEFPSIFNIVVSLVVLTVLTVVVVRSRSALLLSSWLWFFVSIAPVSGIVQIAQNRIADRYMYVPMLGLIGCTLWIASRCFSRKRQPAIIAVTLLAVIFYGGIALSQITVWEDSITLYRHALDSDDRNPKANLNLGAELAEQGRFEEAIRYYRKALAVEPRNVRALANLGRVLSLMGEQRLAIPLLSQAVRQSPEFAMARCNLGIALVSAEEYEDAQEHFRLLVAEYPENGRYWGNLGTSHFRNQEWNAAKQAYQEARQLQPEEPVWQLRYGDCNLRLEDFAEAEKGYTSCILASKAKTTEPHEGLFAVAICRTDFQATAKALEGLKRLKSSSRTYEIQVAVALSLKSRRTTSEQEYVDRIVAGQFQDVCDRAWLEVLSVIVDQPLTEFFDHSEECENPRVAALRSILRSRPLIDKEPPDQG